LGQKLECRLDDLLRSRVIRRLIGIEVTDAITTTAANLAELNAQTPDDVRRVGTNVASFSPELTEMNRELKAFLMQHFYRHPRLVRMSAKAHRVLSDLFLAYVAEPLQLPHEVQGRIRRGPDPLERVICDYIAGMTDRYAILEHKKLFDPEAQA